MNDWVSSLRTTDQNSTLDASSLQEDYTKRNKPQLQSGAKRWLKGNRDWTDGFSPQFHALYSSLRSYNVKEVIKRQIAVIKIQHLVVKTISCARQYKNCII